MKFNLCTKIYFGNNSLTNDNLPHDSNILVFSSQTIKESIHFEELIVTLKENNNTIQQVFKPSNIGEPNTQIINDINKSIENHVDFIIGIGGGSVLDTAKFIAVLKKSNLLAEDYDLNKNNVNSAIKTIMIPTTCGSGSEVTQYAVASNSDTNRKFTISSNHIMPSSCFIIPDFINNLNKNQIINSSIDAFIHCFEGLVNHELNFFIESYAIKSMQLIVKTLPKVLNSSKLNLNLLENLALSSLYGGIVISNNRTGLIHTISVAISEFSNQSHGFLNGKIFPYVLKFNRDYYDDKFNHVASQVFDKKIVDIDESISLFSNFVSSMIYDPINYSNKPNLNHIINRVFQDKGLAKVNPRPLNKINIEEILNKLL